MVWHWRNYAKRIEIRALCVALCMMCGPSESFSVNPRVVHAFNKGEVACISAGHNDANLWIFFWSGASVLTKVSHESGEDYGAYNF